jgi:hypothetical protein
MHLLKLRRFSSYFNVNTQSVTSDVRADWVTFKATDAATLTDGRKSKIEIKRSLWCKNRVSEKLYINKSVWPSGLAWTAHGNFDFPSFLREIQLRIYVLLIFARAFKEGVYSVNKKVATLHTPLTLMFTSIRYKYFTIRINLFAVGLHK